jgi:hypothetical protein
MAKPMTTIQVDVIKSAYRQSKDGFVVSFVIHPQDNHQELANADIGSQWQLTLVELDEHGNAESEVVPNEQSSTDTRPAPTRPQPTQARAARPFTSLPLPQQAALLCQDPIFRAFLNEEAPDNIGTVDTIVDTATALRKICGVASRRDLNPENDGGQTFMQWRDRFIAWKLVAA